jgi:hypothetical protein
VPSTQNHDPRTLTWANDAQPATSVNVNEAIFPDFSDLIDKWHFRYSASSHHPSSVDYI